MLRSLGPMQERSATTEERRQGQFNFRSISLPFAGDYGDKARGWQPYPDAARNRRHVSNSSWHAVELVRVHACDLLQSEDLDPGLSAQ